MSTLTDAEMIAALAAKLAQLTASLAAAEETIRTLRQQGGAVGGSADADTAAETGGGIDIVKLAAAIAERIGQPLPLDVDLWGADEIARYLKMSKSHVTQRYIPRPDFPRAIRLPTGDGHRSHPRWKASEVIAWAERHQDKKRAT